VKTKGWEIDKRFPVRIHKDKDSLLKKIGNKIKYSLTSVDAMYSCNFYLFSFVVVSALVDAKFKV
jgi:hypothetical protein